MGDGKKTVLGPVNVDRMTTTKTERGALGHGCGLVPEEDVPRITTKYP